MSVVLVAMVVAVTVVVEVLVMAASGDNVVVVTEVVCW